MGRERGRKDREARTGRDMTVTHGRHWADVDPSLAGGRPGRGPGAPRCVRVTRYVRRREMRVR